MKLRIYITTKFKGKVSDGRGAYYIIGGHEAEDMKGFGGILRNLSMPRFNAEVCNIAAKNIAAGLDVEFILQDPYAYNIITEGKCEGANKDIWDEFFERTSHLKSFTATRNPHHEMEQTALQKLQNGACL